MRRAIVCACALVLAACAGHRTRAPGTFALAIHGGAGASRATLSDGEAKSYLDALSAALQTGRRILAEGGASLDAVEAVVLQLEDDPRFNAGKGAVFTYEGGHELDASIMDGKTLACGAVTGVRTVKNPIRLARLVMEKSRHVFFAGDGAEAFADSVGVDRVAPAYFDTAKAKKRWEKKMAKERGTVGAVALDTHGNLAAATSTGGLTGKRWGRIGDSPVIGAGTYADNRSCAVSCTGTGEEFIRWGVARDIAALVEYKRLSAREAARRVVFEKLRPDDGGVIVVSNRGEIAFAFSTEGMLRGAADSSGRFEVAVWK